MPTVREANFSDYGQISDLLRRNALEVKRYEEWRDLWTANPSYKKLSQQWPIGWVLEAEDQRLTGFLGNIPLAYQLQGRQLIAAVTHAWAVDPPHRGYAILLLDEYFRQEQPDLFLSTSVNAQASQAFTAFGSQRIPVGAWDQSFFWIGNYRGFAESWLAMKAIPLRSLVSVMLAVPLWLKHRGRGVNASCDSAKVEWCDGFDMRFDRFWEISSQKRSAVLLSIRTREALDWHFGHAISQNKVWLITLKERSDLTAYCIFLRQDNPRYGLKRLRLVDFQTLNESASDLLPMLACALKRCRQHGIHMLEYIGAGIELVSSLTPARRTLPCWLYYYKARTPDLACTLANPNVWKPSSFDGDSSL